MEQYLNLIGALLVASAAYSVPPAYAGPEGCIISVRQLEEDSAKAATSTCVASEHPCGSLATFIIDGKPQRIAIDAKCVPGNIYLSFRTLPENAELYVGGEPYLHMPLGSSEPSHGQFSLFNLTGLMKEDSPGGLYHRPVVRSFTTLPLTIEIEVSQQQLPD